MTAPIVPIPHAVTAPQPAPGVRSANPILARINPSSAYVASGISGLYQGGPLTGKTSYCLTWPKPFFIYADPNTKTFAGHDDVLVFTPQTFQEIETSIVPALRAGEIDCDTVCVDSLSFLSKVLENELGISGGKAEGGKWQAYGMRMHRFIMDMLAMTSSPRMAKKLNVIFTVHERETNNDDGNLVAITPALPGQLREAIARYFDFTFVTMRKLENSIVRAPDGTATLMKTERFYCCTQPPDQFRRCGDRIGGEGHFKKLPPEIVGTYPNLMEAWGIPTNR